MTTGYRSVAVGKKTCLEHRLVMERVLGRRLEAWETVHHVNGNRLDNSPDNLSVIPRGAHIRFHKAGQFKRSRAFVLQEIRRVAKELGRRPRCKSEFQPITGIAHSVVEHMFGTWNHATNLALGEGVRAKEKAGAWNNASAGRIPDKNLLDDFRYVWRTLGHRPSTAEYTKHGRWSHGAFYAHYGSWGAIPIKGADL